MPGAATPDRRLVWVDRTGAASPTADGQRFVMIQAPAAPTGFVVVLNWFEELTARTSAGR